MARDISNRQITSQQNFDGTRKDRHPRMVDRRPMVPRQTFARGREREMSQNMPAATQMCRGEKVVTGLAMAVLAAAFAAGEFGVVADGRPPLSQESFMNASANLSAMPIPINAVTQSSDQVAGRGFVCQLADAVWSSETALQPIRLSRIVRGASRSPDFVSSCDREDDATRPPGASGGPYCLGHF